ncbi:MAG: class I SAM-dependent methyltransferase [Candidatus Dormibacteraceae bacterium]
MAEPGPLKSKELFPAVFSRHALAYQQRLEQVMARGEARGRMRVLELVEARPGMRVIDLACGPGTLSRRLMQSVSPGGAIVGVDLAPGMIELARESIPGAHFEVMDIERLEFTDGSFDAAVCGHGLQFAPDLGAALREARRVLRPGGRLAASVPVEETNDSVWTVLDAVIDRWLAPAPQAADRTATSATVGDVDDFDQAALDAGFATALVEVIEEKVRWASAEQLVAMFTSWWCCASRLDEIDDRRRRGFTKEAVETLQRAYPSVIETTGRNHVLLAVA